MQQKDTLLIEIGVEELPSSQFKDLVTEFENIFTNHLKEANLDFGKVKSYIAPRRIALQILDLDYIQKDLLVEKLGPTLKVAYDENKKPSKAALGFAKSCGVDFAELSTCESPQGEKLFYKQLVKGKNLQEIIPKTLYNSINKLPVKKRMRWSDNDYSFSRPVHWLVVMFGDKILPAEEFKHASQNKTLGHRFSNKGFIEIDNASNYENILNENFVIADFETRKLEIKKQLEEKSNSISADIILNNNLLEEVTSIVDWPTVLIGEFPSEFLEVPEEALISSMQSHQKCFPLKISGKLTNKFLLTSNLIGDNYQDVISGNNKVMQARLSDAKFFFEQDKKNKISSLTENLKRVTFQNKLGSIYDKTIRVEKISKYISSYTKAKNSYIEEVCAIYKCDLVSGMVGEFPELQGVMGQYYASIEGYNEEVAASIKESYMPRNAHDNLPETKTGITVSLADKLDTLVGIFAIGLEPTGEKDPFALRRTAIGILKIIIEKRINLNIAELLENVKKHYNIAIKDDLTTKVNFFLIERLKVLLSENYPVKNIDAVLATGLNSPLEIKNRLNSLKEFFKLGQAESLASANKRVRNILAKNKLLKTSFNHINIELFEDIEEKELYENLIKIEKKITPLINEQKFTEALKELTNLDQYIANFFDKVMVMAENEKVKQNRLALISHLRNTFTKIADISLIS